MTFLQPCDILFVSLLEIHPFCLRSFSRTRVLSHERISSKGCRRAVVLHLCRKGFLSASPPTRKLGEQKYHQVPRVPWTRRRRRLEKERGFVTVGREDRVVDGPVRVLRADFGPEVGPKLKHVRESVSFFKNLGLKTQRAHRNTRVYRAAGVHHDGQELDLFSCGGPTIVNRRQTPWASTHDGERQLSARGVSRHQAAGTPTRFRHV